MRKKMIKLAITIVVVLVTLAFIGSLLLRDRAGEMMKQAFSLRDADRNEEASDLFGQVSMMYPDSAYGDDALFELGFTYYVIRFPKAPEQDKGIYLRLALNAFEKIIRQYPSSPFLEKSRVYLAEIYTTMGNVPKALENYEAASRLVRDPAQLQEIHFHMSRAYDLLERPEKAIEELRKVIESGIGGRYYESAFIALARYYRYAAAESDSSSTQYYEAVVKLMEDLLNGENEVTQTTRQEALLIKAHGQLELKQFDAAKGTLEELDKLPISPSNRALIVDYRDRLDRQSQMGRN